MRIQIACPASPAAHGGNRATAERWRRILRALGHRTTIVETWDDEPCDLLVALHARRSAGSSERFRRASPHAPLIVALTGTDLYRDLARSPRARRALDAAMRLIVLQPHGIAALPPHLRARARVIHQSARRPRGRVASPGRFFLVSVVGHLRPVKDPFRAEAAVRTLPADSRIRVVHAGAALAPRVAAEARRRAAANPRYRWLGELPHGRARLLIARSRVHVLTSRIEGGANVLSEAIVADVPILASRIPSSEGILGGDYPGFFPGGDARALRGLLLRAERDAAFLDALRERGRRVRPLLRPERERRAWRRLLAEL